MSLPLEGMGHTSETHELPSLQDLGAPDEEVLYDGDAFAQDDIITLNVGGSIFTTRRQTCLKVPPFACILFIACDIYIPNTSNAEAIHCHWRSRLSSFVVLFCTRMPVLDIGQGASRPQS